MNEGNYYCYRLRYPKGFVANDDTDLSDIVFYVGKGQGDRMRHHEVEARSERLEDGVNTKKMAAIRSIWEKGMEVQKEVFFRSHSEREALISEAWDIRENMGPHLTNRRILSVAAIRRYADEKPNPMVHGSVLPFPARKMPKPHEVYTHLNTALVVDGKVDYRYLCGSNDSFVPVVIECQGVCIDGNPCKSHIGEKVTIVDASVVDNHNLEILKKYS